MKRHGSSFALAVGGFLMAAGLIGLMNASAETPGQSRQPGQWDMWNPNWMQRDMWGPGQMGPGMQQRMARHWTFMHQGIPPEYRGARNPISVTAETIDEGRVLYRETCSSCHGATGLGDGERANSLTPSPALLAYMIQRPMAVDEYLLWSISDGGRAFNTAMPAFKDDLTQDEIWRIVSYMRAGFPAGGEQQ
ncbi:MAG: cytochrome c [Gammaproteobacteria bacterium]